MFESLEKVSSFFKHFANISNQYPIDTFAFAKAINNGQVTFVTSDPFFIENINDIEDRFGVKIIVNSIEEAA